MMDINVSYLRFEKQKTGFLYNITDALENLQIYYSNNFQTLMLINFLPYYTSDYNGFKDILIYNNSFSKVDIENFIIHLLMF
jgi:hypothetical protein